MALIPREQRRLPPAAGVATFRWLGPGTNTRARLIDAAIAVIEADGERSIRGDGLARSVNVAKPSAHHFFGSHEGVVVAALTELCRRSLFSERRLLTEIAPSADGGVWDALTCEAFTHLLFGEVDDGRRGW